MGTDPRAGLGTEIEETMAALLRPSFSYSGGPLRFADFYPGLGCASLAAQNLGMDLIYAVEPDQMTARSYHINFGMRPEQRVALPDDVPHANFVAIHIIEDGFLDLETKGSHFQEAARYLRVVRPQAVVADILQSEESKYIDQELRALHYWTDRRDIGDLTFIVGMPDESIIEWPEDRGLPDVHHARELVRFHEALPSMGFPENWNTPPEILLYLRLAESNALHVKQMETILGSIDSALRTGRK